MALTDIFIGAGVIWFLLGVAFLIFWIIQLVMTIQKKKYLYFILILLIPVMAIVYWIVNNTKHKIVKWGL
jgi:hypothetical protein